jgi:hypothetical protein
VGVIAQLGDVHTAGGNDAARERLEFGKDFFGIGANEF